MATQTRQLAKKSKAVAKKPPVALGRKSKRTPEVEAKLIEALKKGNTYRAACAYSGISESEFYEWKSECAEFMERITRAENVAEFAYVDVIQECANNGDWKAAAWWLERRRKLEYSARQEVELSGGLRVERKAEELSDDELATIAARSGNRDSKAT